MPAGGGCKNAGAFSSASRASALACDQVLGRLTFGRESASTTEISAEYRVMTVTTTTSFPWFLGQPGPSVIADALYRSD
jgi:hypothetical protein